MSERSVSRRRFLSGLGLTGLGVAAVGTAGVAGVGALTDADADINDDPDNLLNQVPEDTGEALDLASGNLTVTVGFGPSLFDDRFGLKDRKPEELEPLPKFPGDQLQDALCDGDIVIHACADDP